VLLLLLTANTDRICTNLPFPFPKVFLIPEGQVEALPMSAGVKTEEGGVKRLFISLDHGLIISKG
jgi:hypothetical protein